MLSLPRSYLEENWKHPVSCQLTEKSVERQPVKRRQEVFCEIAASLGVVS
jgi:hypothetical protein